MTPYDSVERQQLEARMKSGANWFYRIAALVGLDRQAPPPPAPVPMG